MNIYNLHSHSSPKGCFYIFDSNVWLPLLGLNNESVGEHYKIYFSKVLKTDGAKIILCPIQLSEILNKLLRFYGRKAYDKKYSNTSGSGKPLYNTFYKDEYRGSEDFKAHYDSIIDDISQYEDYLLVRHVSSESLDFYTAFDAKKLDFNDHYLYQLAKEIDSTLITHDGDFFGLDIHVGTFNLKLYKKHTDGIKPK